MAGEEIKVEGLKELKATLDRLPARLGDKVVVAALRAGAQVVRKAAQARAPILAKPDKRRKAGTMRAAILVRRSKRDKLAVFVGVKPLSKFKKADFKRGQVGAGKKAKGSENPNDPYYWWWVEFGTKKKEARPFLRPAFEENKFAALRRFEEFAKTRIKREAEKLAREMGSKIA